VTIGTMLKREAQAKAREIMSTINRSAYVITSQIRLEEFVREYMVMHVEALSASTQGKYKNHLNNHILPAFGERMLCEIDTVLVQQWLNAKGAPVEPAKADQPLGLKWADIANAKVKAKGEGLSWATRTDIRNVFSSIFTKAIEWGRWKDRNPIEHVHAGRKRAVREQRKLTTEETTRLLAALPFDVRVACAVALFCTLRISEILGLQEKHLDFANNRILVRQRFYRGDLDVPKNQASVRDAPMGHLSTELRALCQGDPERYVFQIQTYVGRDKKPRIVRDDRGINQHFLRKAAKGLGLYWKGFGFHAFRREAVTAINARLGIAQAMKLSGHSKADMSIHYTLLDEQALDRVTRERQEEILGKPTGKVN
jgi:integrase